MPATVLIAPPEQLSVLRDRDDLNNALAFPDSDALGALDAITRQRPDIVALERLFAATSRGMALINRIKADPALTACEIRIVAHDTAPASRMAPVPATAAPEPAAPPPRAAAMAPPHTVHLPGAQLDEHGTRRAPRYDIADGTEVLIDGNPAALIDLSIVGAQVRLPTILRPNQRVRLSLPAPGRPIRFGGSIAWARFEIPKEGPRYRAGVEFYGADAAAIEQFIAAHRREVR